MSEAKEFFFYKWSQGFNLIFQNNLTFLTQGIWLLKFWLFAWFIYQTY